MVFMMGMVAGAAAYCATTKYVMPKVKAKLAVWMAK